MAKNTDNAIFGDSGFNLNQFSSQLANVATMFPEFRTIFADKNGLATYPNAPYELIGFLAVIAKKQSEHYSFKVQYEKGFLMIKIKCEHLALIVKHSHQIEFEDTQNDCSIIWSTGSVEQEEIDAFVAQANKIGLNCHKELTVNYDADVWLEQ